MKHPVRIAVIALIVLAAGSSYFLFKPKAPAELAKAPASAPGVAAAGGAAAPGAGGVAKAPGGGPGGPGAGAGGGGGARPPGGGGGAGAGGGGAPIPVTGVKVQPVLFAETIAANGTLRAEESVELQTEVNGKIVALNFTEGTPVKVGDVLVKIDDSTLVASLRRAEARRELARFREQRLAKLVDEGGVSKFDYDAARSELAVQEAECSLILADIRKTEIRAPFDGTVGLRFVSLGAYVNPTTRIATLQKVSNLKVDFSVPERYATRIHAGAPVSFKVAGSPRVFTGEVYAVEPRIDVGTRTLLLRAKCNNPDFALIPGIFADIEFTVSQAENALLVPAIAVISGLDERFVFIAKEGKAQRVRVTTGPRTSTQVQIIKGLNPGDVVLTTGVQQLRPGLAVKVDLAK
ncbi:MAG: efflux RND transporter periplasmic adaptor subunit [Verrucomicrobia bacterium]|nr:efflux RND transporter periplasmic adaptor subunit [Verrucomicrobiota bacterium]